MLYCAIRVAIIYKLLNFKVCLIKQKWAIFWNKEYLKYICRFAMICLIKNIQPVFRLTGVIKWWQTIYFQAFQILNWYTILPLQLCLNCSQHQNMLLPGKKYSTPSLISHTLSWVVRILVGHHASSWIFCPGIYFVVIFYWNFGTLSLCN